MNYIDIICNMYITGIESKCFNDMKNDGICLI